MIRSIFARIIGYIVIAGLAVFLVGPGWSWVNGNGFVFEENYWIALAGFAVVVVWTEIARFRRVNRGRFK